MIQVLAISEGVQLALIAVGSPSLLALLTAYITRRSKLEDWKRLDDVADKAEEVAAAAKKAAEDLEKENEARRVEAIRQQTEVSEQAKEAAELLRLGQGERDRRLDEVARLAANTAKTHGEKLDEIDRQSRAIHTLVNQKLTTALEETLSGQIELLDLTEGLNAKIRSAGGEVDQASLDRAERAKGTIARLKTELSDRGDAQAQVEADDDEADSPIE